MNFLSIAIDPPALWLLHPQLPRAYLIQLIGHPQYHPLESKDLALCHDQGAVHQSDVRQGSNTEGGWTQVWKVWNLGHELPKARMRGDVDASHTSWRNDMQVFILMMSIPCELQRPHCQRNVLRGETLQSNREVIRVHEMWKFIAVDFKLFVPLCRGFIHPR